MHITSPFKHWQISQFLLLVTPLDWIEKENRETEYFISSLMFEDVLYSIQEYFTLSFKVTIFQGNGDMKIVED